MDEKAKRRVEAFFEKLLFMIKAKVLLNQGDLKATEIIWTYPSSMTSGRVAKLKELWEGAITKYLTTDKYLKISESIAPYYYYKAKGVYAGTKPTLNIDIGGGTTDIVVYMNDKPQLLTSFRFAANAIFGDGFNNRGAESNGFVQKYAKNFQAKLNDNGLSNVSSILAIMDKNKNSIEVISALFSIEEFPEIIQRNIPISFHSSLKDDNDLRLVFLVFYTAILYYISKLMIKANMPLPRYITLSGRGSKVLNILGDNNQLKYLSKVILKKIHNLENNKDFDLDIITDEINPKEVTCKGALEMSESELKEMEDVHFIKSIKKNWSGMKDEDRLAEPLTYGDINTAVMQSLKKEIEFFTDFVFDLHKDIHFQNELNISISGLSEYKTLLKKDIETHIEEGLNTRKKELQDYFEHSLEEPLFFYHFIPALYKLANAIYKKNS
jgi:hypothetical protein